MSLMNFEKVHSRLMARFIDKRIACRSVLAHVEQTHHVDRAPFSKSFSYPGGMELFDMIQAHDALEHLFEKAGLGCFHELSMATLESWMPHNIALCIQWNAHQGFEEPKRPNAA
jgi:hypothetical protein